MIPALRLLVRHNDRALAAWALLLALLLLFLSIHPRGASGGVLAAWANQGVALAFVAVGQTIVVLTRGIDLSAGAILALCNCAASALVRGDPAEVALGIAAVCLIGAACGALNGLIVVRGRIQPIVATLATGAILSGVALLVRPTPGGSVDDRLADALTGTVGGVVPVSLLLLAVLVAAIWGPVRASLTGRTILAVGSAEPAAYMSGLPVDRAKVAAYALAGLFAAFGGLFLGFQTLSGDPSVGASYTLNSVAAVVLGGTALAGGAGSVAGSIAGALVLRTVGSLIFFTGLDPMAQPLFEGAVLLVAVALGAGRLLRIRNRLEVFR
ncbi:ABC transporter permease [Azospirillum halopraeferens]|uniref:ABC transporter permease n=1 Tax=Azospirillum halopraeferens TaxID=34010 RepID=UPI000428D8C7|nr:ABC transporter permease [Azospirillum halopraeferens]